jgi:hypothetical protein
MGFREEIAAALPSCGRKLECLSMGCLPKQQNLRGSASFKTASPLQDASVLVRNYMIA